MLHESPGRLVEGTAPQVSDIIFDASDLENVSTEASIIGHISRFGCNPPTMTQRVCSLLLGELRDWEAMGEGGPGTQEVLLMVAEGGKYE